ncbi:MAG: GNAT family N-acetyltransferase [Clostridia bacterium]|nr:GNAT family N-acetyltransferase [Clostridia bacterium]
MNPNIRPARTEDAARIAEIEIFNYRLNFYPIFQSDAYYFDELQVPARMEELLADGLSGFYVYDDGVVKGFIRVCGDELKKLFVEPVLQGQHIGATLLDYALSAHGVTWLWALEKNTRAIRFYERHGFRLTDTKIPEEDTTEYLIRMEH